MPKINLSRFNNKHFLALTGNGVISVFGLATYALLYRTFSLSDVGTWGFFMATQGLLDAIRNGFLGTATIKFYAGAETRRASNVLGSVWYLAIALTSIILLLNAGAFVLLPFITNFQIIITIKWIGLTVLSTLPFTVIFWKLQADERYDTILWMRMTNSGSMILSFVVLLLLGKLSLETALLWNFITNCLTSLAGLIANLGGIKNITARSKETLTELFHFGKYSLASNMSANLMGVADTFIVTFMLGPAAVAILSVPSRLLELVEIPLRSFVGTGMSGMAVAFNQNNMYHLKHILNKYAGMLTFAIIPMTLGVLLLAELPVSILSGGKYSGTEAANIYRFFMFTALLYPMDRFNGVALDIIHQPRLNFIKVQIMLFVKITSSVLLISLLNSIYAVPMSGMITMIAGFTFGYINLRKFVNYSIAETLSTGLNELKFLAAKFLKNKKLE